MSVVSRISPEVMDAKEYAERCLGLKRALDAEREDLELNYEG